MPLVELSAEEISVLDSALQDYENAPLKGEESSSLIGAIMTSAFPGGKGQFKEIQARKEREAQSKSDQRKRQSVLLRAKLYMAVEIPPPSLVLLQTHEAYGRD